MVDAVLFTVVDVVVVVVVVVVGQSPRLQKGTMDPSLHWNFIPASQATMNINHSDTEYITWA